jgi:hypothetical protein
MSKTQPCNFQWIKQHAYPLPETFKEKVRGWEGQLNEMVARL